MNSGIATVARLAADEVRNRVVFLATRARRTKPGPALVRLTTAAAAFGALALALPGNVAHSGALPLTLILLTQVAAGVGLFPRTRWVTLVAVFAVCAYLVSTIGFEEPVHPWRVGMLAASLYVMHAGAAFAAVLPYDCVVAPGVALRWAGRAAGVLCVSLGIGLGAMVAAGQLPSARSVVGPIIGSVVAAGLAGLLAWHLRRR